MSCNPYKMESVHTLFCRAVRELETLRGNMTQKQARSGTNCYKRSSVTHRRRLTWCINPVFGRPAFKECGLYGNPEVLLKEE